MTNPENFDPYRQDSSSYIRNASQCDPLRYVQSAKSQVKLKNKKLPEFCSSFNSNKIYRQGDILFRKIALLPKNLKEKQNSVVVEGEQTGHAHVLVNGAVFELLDSEKMFIKAGQNTKIIHEEHLPIKLESGIYEVIRQREYLREGITQIVRD